MLFFANPIPTTINSLPKRKKTDNGIPPPETPKPSRNRFNRLTSKEWLPFQKSWFRYSSLAALYVDNVRFFTKIETDADAVFYQGAHLELMETATANNGNVLLTELTELAETTSVQFALFDYTECITSTTTIADYQLLKQRLIEQLLQLYPLLLHRRFVAVLLPNVESEDGVFVPLAWDLAIAVGRIFTLKDEKIAGMEVETTDNITSTPHFRTNQSTFYCLYFRKDENSAGAYTPADEPLLRQAKPQQSTSLTFEQAFPGWFILKPKPRKKDELLHPAKYPEELVDRFVQTFTKVGDNVFDPMSGTGSTQLGALRNGRNGYGTELSEFFAPIAVQRCSNFLQTQASTFFNEQPTVQFNILQTDARHIQPTDFPPIDYILTSPPYWDMLNMKGAENQAKRIKMGLQTNYSGSESDLGNIADYHRFLDELTGIYLHLITLLKPGGYFTIVVKNIKKQGKNYPFAWDLAARLGEQLILLPEVFWCQDDLSIAPYGYGNTWVSNTFHQYCLNFSEAVLTMINV